jgi:ATP-dependent protease ClpP protease subunit
LGGWFYAERDVAEVLADHGDGDITVRVNSGGGIAFDGMAIHSILKSHPGKVTVAIDGIAASAASLIAMAGAPIEMRDGALMMIHDPSGLTLGTEDTHRAAADKLGKIAENYAGGRKWKPPNWSHCRSGGRLA